MVTAVNDFDTILQAETPRTLASNLGGGGVKLSTTANVVKVTNGTPDQTIITMQASPLVVAGTLTWSASPNVPYTLDQTNTILTLRYADMGTSSVKITVKLTTADGIIYQDYQNITQVTNGSQGVNAVSGFLTAAAVSLAADSAGNIASFANAAGTFNVLDGVTDKTGNAAVTYSKISAVGCTATIDATGAYSVSAMSADNATVVLQAVYGGVTIQRTFSLSKSRAGGGGTGSPGSRGAGHYYATGGVWSDTVASAACPGGPVDHDVVTISNSTSVFEKYYLASNQSWNQQGIVINGSLIVQNSILAAAINANGLTVRDVNGGILIDASGAKTLAQQVSSNPNLAPTPIGFIYPKPQGGQIAPTGNRNGDVRFADGQYIWFSPASTTDTIMAYTPPLGIPLYGSYYTVSFDAYQTGGSGRVMVVDVFGTGVDSAGIAITPPQDVLTHYTFTELMPSSGTNGDAALRFFSQYAGGGYIVVSSIKVELGNTATPWCDSVITGANAPSFVKIPYLSVMAFKVGLLQTAASGARSQIKDDLISVIDTTSAPRVKIGNTSMNPT